MHRGMHVAGILLSPLSAPHVPLGRVGNGLLDADDLPDIF